MLIISDAEISIFENHWNLQQNVMLMSLIQTCNHSKTQNTTTSTEGAIINKNNNCSLPHDCDCCHQNWKTTSCNMVYADSTITFNFLFWMDQYSQLIDENFQYYV